MALGACGNPDRLGPSEEAPAPVAPELATAAAPAGIVSASAQLPVDLLSSVLTGPSLPTSPSAILTYLAKVKARSGRVLLKLHGSELAIENPDGTFSLTK